MNKSLKLLILTNVIIGLYAGFAFYIGSLWGIDDDADASKVAWGHLAVRRFTEDIQYAFWIALICLVLSWIIAYVSTRDFKQSAQWALYLGLLTLSLIAIGSAVGNIQFYIERPIGI